MTGFGFRMFERWRLWLENDQEKRIQRSFIKIRTIQIKQIWHSFLSLSVGTEIYPGMRSAQSTENNVHDNTIRQNLAHILISTQRKLNVQSQLHAGSGKTLRPKISTTTESLPFFPLNWKCSTWRDVSRCLECFMLFYFYPISHLPLQKTALPIILSCPSLLCATCQKHFAVSSCLTFMRQIQLSPAL